MHARPSPRRLLALALAISLATACNDDEPDRAATTTTTARDTATSSTSTSEPSSTAPPATVPAEPAALRGDGLGLASFGQPPEVAIPALAPLLGNPSEDTGWQPAFSTFGTCPGENIRAVRWGGLTVLFSDGTTAHGSGPHFFQWRQATAPPPIATVKGLSVGATRADAEELYDEVVVTEDELVGGPILEVQVEGGPLVGFLDQADVITNLEAGTPCGE